MHTPFFISIVGLAPQCGLDLFLLLPYIDYIMGKIKRNETCFCGSGKKYKHCCLNKDTPIAKVFDNKLFIEQDTNENDIFIIFDTNAHSFLIDQNNYSNIIDNFEKSKPKIIPHFTDINFYEYLKGINTVEELIKRQKYIKNIYKSTLGGSLFLSSKSHIQDAIGQLNLASKQEEILNILKYIRFFINLKSLSDFKNTLKKMQDETLKELVRIKHNKSLRQKNMIQIFKDYRKSNNLKEIKSRLQSLPKEDDYNVLIPIILERFEVKAFNKSINRKNIFSVLPSLKYFIDVNWKYNCQMTLNKRKVQANDYFDIEQVIYLNIADYLVTREKNLLSWINDSGNPELKGRAISPNDLLNLINTNKIIKRAPQIAKRYKIVKR